MNQQKCEYASNTLKELKKRYPGLTWSVRESEEGSASDLVFWGCSNHCTISIERPAAFEELAAGAGCDDLRGDIQIEISSKWMGPAAMLDYLLDEFETVKP